MRKVFRTAVVLLAPVWPMCNLWQAAPAFSPGSILSGRLDSVGLAIVVNVLILVTWLVLLNEHRIARRQSTFVDPAEPAGQRSRMRTGALWALGLTTVTQGVTLGSATKESSHVAVPIGDVVTPAIAGSILTQILMRRREQVIHRRRPDRLTESEMAAVGQLVRMANPSQPGVPPRDREVSIHDPVELMAAIDREPQGEERAGGRIDWEIKVRLYGYPDVVGAGGVEAQFRKKKALELLVWLVLNRDRARRSAARTCLWDFAINDSTFSTVISDMRRALSALGGSQTHQNWVPPTYSDVIPLAPTITSDYELLREAHGDFLHDVANANVLTNMVADIRDIPFAGTNYLWADLDGTTTRLVIAALDACRDLATWALTNNRRSELDVAVSAALRVMPGCEEFLEIQNQYLSSSYTYRRASRR